MECRCGASVVSGARSCPQCGWLINPVAPVEIVGQLKRSTTPVPSHDRRRPPKRKESRKPSFTPPEFVLPPGRLRRSGDDLLPPRTFAARGASTQRPPLRLTPPPAMPLSLPKRLASATIELDGPLERHVVMGQPQSTELFACQLVLVATRLQGAPVILYRSKRFMLTDLLRPTHEALIRLDELRRRASASDLVEQAPAAGMTWYGYSYRPR